MQDTQTFRVKGSWDCPHATTKWAVLVNKYDHHTLPGLVTPTVTKQRCIIATSRATQLRYMLCVVYVTGGAIVHATRLIRRYQFKD